MNKKFTIKSKLLFSTLIIQAFTLIFFSYGLYKLLESSTYEKIQSNMKIITLDIMDDIAEHKKLLENIDLEEAEEFKIKPLYVRIIEPNSLKPVVSTRFPKSLKLDKKNFEDLELEDIKIERENGYVISRSKIKFKNKIELVIEIATTQEVLNTALDNLLSILLMIVPIIFLISIIGTIMLLNKSFQPIKNILNDLQNIQATNLSQRIKFNDSNDEIDNLSKEINNLLDRLESSFEKVKQFSSDASHELKTPLTIIRGEIEIALKKERTQEEYKEVLNIALNEVLVIQQTINDLLFLSKEEHENKEREDVYLDEVSIDAIIELKSFALTKKVTLETDIKQALQIKGFANLIKIAVKNILKNAIEFSYENSKVIVSNYKEENKCIIEISDSGIGISKDEQNKVFDKFYRTDKSRNKNSGGTGLGMAICKKIIQMHNGIIHIESKENIGTTIKLEFPK